MERRRKEETNGKTKGGEFIFVLIATELRNCPTSKIAPHAGSSQLHSLARFSSPSCFRSSLLETVLFTPISPPPPRNSAFSSNSPQPLSYPAFPSLFIVKVRLFDVGGFAFLPNAGDSRKRKLRLGYRLATRFADPRLSTLIESN